MTTTKAPAKTIFEKTYLARSQAEKAAAKEFGATWEDNYDVSVKADVLPARFVVVAKPALVTPPALVESAPVGKNQQAIANAMAALTSIEKVAHDVVENLTLAQALAESGETLSQVLDDKPVPKYVEGTGRQGCGYDNCPGCGIDLSNGVMDWDTLVEQHGGRTREHQQHEWSCMGCGAEWGPKRAGIKIEKDRPEQNGVTRPSQGGVCAKIWAECDARSANGMVPPVKDMKAWALAESVDQTTCLIQYYQWRKYMGVVGRAKEMPTK